LKRFSITLSRTRPTSIVVMSDGSVRQLTLKVFYDGPTNGVFNSVLANHFVERAGAGAVS